MAFPQEPIPSARQAPDLIAQVEARSARVRAELEAERIVGAAGQAGWNPRSGPLPVAYAARIAEVLANARVEAAEAKRIAALRSEPRPRPGSTDTQLAELHSSLSLIAGQLNALGREVASLRAVVESQATPAPSVAEPHPAQAPMAEPAAVPVSVAEPAAAQDPGVPVAPVPPRIAAPEPAPMPVPPLAPAAGPHVAVEAAADEPPRRSRLSDRTKHVLAIAMLLPIGAAAKVSLPAALALMVISAILLHVRWWTLVIWAAGLTGILELYDVLDESAAIDSVAILVTICVVGAAAMAVNEAWERMRGDALKVVGRPGKEKSPP